MPVDSATTAEAIPMDKATEELKEFLNRHGHKDSKESVIRKWDHFLQETKSYHKQQVSNLYYRYKVEKRKIGELQKTFVGILNEMIKDEKQRDKFSKKQTIVH